ncbi:MAG: class I SAM-dependent methyltransferase [Salana multivorans]|uniref:class I SAM-dependent methyltransferase n=1 Tax=Salana multivorans TaxID=120377 RepID=UPI00095F461A|nr:class I SAM-dependent methyltransferase [Salana multivorans]MBN8883052.1 class I SAM-dependent methyltransferase [Salana multivorans]OJX98339.1 MAG: hypothetical protein BGO96_03920 [Micrococcales bacterium 73-15]
MIYRTSVDESNANNSQAAILRRIQHSVAPGARILDVGCAAGDLAEALSNHGYQVWGIDVDPDAYEHARKVLTGGAVGDLNAVSLSDLVEGPFDAIIFGDVLEHLLDPGRHLRTARAMLAPGGCVLASIPNVAHGAVRLALLEGRWRYTSEGLLDATHVRFFTYETVVALFHENGYGISSIEGTILDPLATEVDVDAQLLPDGSVEWVRDQEHATVFQFVVEAHPGEVADPEPACLPLIEYQRPNDAHAARRRIGDVPTARAERQAQILESFKKERLEMLSLRDYAMGGEASAARSRREADHLRELTVELREELIETHARLASTIEDVLLTHERLSAAHAENARLQHLARPFGRSRALAGRAAHWFRRRVGGR